MQRSPRRQAASAKVAATPILPVPAVPEMAGTTDEVVESAAGAVTATVGAWVSTVKVTVGLVPTWPPWSD